MRLLKWILVFSYLGAFISNTSLVVNSRHLNLQINLNFGTQQQQQQKETQQHTHTE